MKCKLSSEFKKDFKSFCKEQMILLAIIGMLFIVLPSICFIFGYISGNVFNYWPDVQADSPFSYYGNVGLGVFLIIFILIALLIIIIKTYLLLKNYKKVVGYIFDCKENK